MIWLDQCNQTLKALLSCVSSLAGRSVAVPFRVIGHWPIVSGGGAVCFICVGVDRGNMFPLFNRQTKKLFKNPALITFDTLVLLGVVSVCFA